MLSVAHSDSKSFFLSSSLDKAPLALVANRPAKESRPATYNPSGLKQIIRSPDLGFSNSDGHPAWLQGASSKSIMHASGRPPVLFNIREAFEAEVPGNWDECGPALAVTVSLPVCLPVCLLGHWRPLGPRLYSLDSLRQPKQTFYVLCAKSKDSPCLRGARGALGPASVGLVLAVRSEMLPHGLGRLAEARPL